MKRGICAWVVAWLLLAGVALAEENLTVFVSKKAMSPQTAMQLTGLMARELKLDEISLIEEEKGICYESLQRKAIAQAAQQPVFILTGGPGTGKTTTVNGMIELFEQQGKTVLLTAPTGRAAKRMTEVTGREAKTIHRLLEVEPG